MPEMRKELNGSDEIILIFNTRFFKWSQQVTKAALRDGAIDYHRTDAEEKNN